MKTKTVVKVEQDPEQIVERQVLATAIVEISRAMKAAMRSGLTKEAIIVLVQHNCRPHGRNSPKPGMADVREVLYQVDQLEAWAVRK